jgi:hypothetical protein
VKRQPLVASVEKAAPILKKVQAILTDLNSGKTLKGNNEEIALNILVCLLENCDTAHETMHTWAVTYGVEVQKSKKRKTIG